MNCSSRSIAYGKICRPWGAWLTAALFLTPGIARGQWAPDGVPICDGCISNLFFVEADGAGGAFIGWRESRNVSTTDTDVFAQRITANGEVAPGWPVQGMGLCVTVQSQSTAGISLDRNGGMFATWLDMRGDNDVYAQRVTGGGEISPGWPGNGVPVCRAQNSQGTVTVAPDGYGGAYFAWQDDRDLQSDLYAQRLDSTGAVASGWMTDGIAIATGAPSDNSPRALNDGEGGTFLVWTRFDPSLGTASAFGTRLRPDASIASGWSAGGKLLLAGRGRTPAILDDRSGGFYLISSSVADLAFSGSIWVQRYTSSGEPFPGWPPDGVLVCGAPDVRDGIRVAEDGLGGVLVTWYDYRAGLAIYAARVLHDGTLAPGWAPNGTQLSNPAAPGINYDPVISSDGMGGAYVAWIRENPGYRAYIQHLTPQGQVAAGWPQYGARVSSRAAQFHPEIVTDVAGGAILVWEERSSPWGLFAQRYQNDGPVPTLLSLVSAEAEAGIVRLQWQGDAHVNAALERRTERDPAWFELQRLTSDASGRFIHEDRDVEAGVRYAYRLRWGSGASEQVTADAWVTVPAPLALSLEGLRPNPAHRDLTVAFTLATPGTARVEVLDVTGRQRLVRGLGFLGAGQHAMRVGAAGQLEPGVYWIRLIQGLEQRLTRGVVVR